LVTTIGFCTECHGADLGGMVMDDDPIVGRLVAPNLTSGAGGKGRELTDEDIVRAIRHGVDKDGTSLVIMPSTLFYGLSDDDLGAIVAYLRTVPPVDNQLPEISVGPLGRVFLLQFPDAFPAAVIDHTGPRPPAPEPGVTAEYGEYLAFNCRTCHGPDMAGQPEDLGGGTNLTPGGELREWTVDDFIQTIRTRVNPRGEEIDPELAPLFATIGRMSDDELTAIWLYLRSLPPIENTPEP
jgi:mono/diheme cytochrome c family protein